MPEEAENASAVVCDDEDRGSITILVRDEQGGGARDAETHFQINQRVVRCVTVR